MFAKIYTEKGIEMVRRKARHKVDGKIVRRGGACTFAVLLALAAAGCGSTKATEEAAEETGTQQTDKEQVGSTAAGRQNAEGAVYTVHTDTSVLDESSRISENLFGLFLEDINYALDGGMYVEMVKNRSFEYGMEARDAELHGWALTDDGVELRSADGSEDGTALHENNPHYAVVSNDGSSADRTYAGICNDGFIEGMAIEKGSKYDVSFFAKAAETETNREAYITLKGEDGTIYAQEKVEGISQQWEKYSVTLTASETANRGVLLCIEILPGEMCFDMISMMPQETYQGLPVRKDFGEYLEALKPAFLRFPGGCVVEGRDEESIYSWKDSIGNGMSLVINGEECVGDPAVRPQGKDIWQGSAANPYYTTYGIGFYEFFELCEALDCMPVPVLNAGMTCEVQSPFYKVYSIASEEFKQYVQDALDLVEFCRGDASTKWGAVRIAMGHEEPFALTYLAIGNEQWQSEYHQHYQQFVKAFERAAQENPELYGDIRLIVANGTVSESEDGWNYLILNPDSVTALVDEHYYQTPEWFLEHTDRYDAYDRNAQAKVFLGEYAAKANTMDAALAEAAYMTGLEKNGDVVEMACYAPLFSHYKLNQWVPDMIYYSNDAIYGSVNYYVQQLFSVNDGRISLPTEMSGVEEKTLYESASVDEEGDLLLKLVNVTGEEIMLRVLLEELDVTAYDAQAEVTVLRGADEKAVNSMESMAVLPETQELCVGDDFDYEVPPYSLTVIRLRKK